MNFRTVKTVIAREYLTKVKKKSFLLTTFLVPVLMAAAIVVMVLIMTQTGERKQNVAVIDQSGIVLPYLTDNKANTYLDFSTENPEDFKQRLDEFAMDVAVVISPLDTVAKTVSVQAYSKKPLSVDFSEEVARKVNDAVEAYRIDAYGIENLSQIMKDVQSNVHVTEYTLDDSGNETVSESGIYMGVSMVLGVFIFMFITMFSGMVMSSVIEEKSSRVVEVLISSAKATELMFGKIIGVACVALTQFFLWIVLTLLIIGGINLFGGFGKLMGGSDPKAAMEMVQDMQSMPGYHPDGGATLDLGMLSDSTAVAGTPTGLQAVMETLGSLNYTEIIIAFILFFVFGYLLYASLFAAIGSAVENEADTQQLQIPVTIPLMLAFFIAIYAFRAPDSPIVWWGSMIPFTSPIVMLARIPFGVPFWELALSVLLLVGTVVLSCWISAKIYKVGILMYGKKSTFKDLWNWFKMK